MYTLHWSLVHTSIVNYIIQIYYSICIICITYITAYTYTVCMEKRMGFYKGSQVGMACPLLLNMHVHLRHLPCTQKRSCSWRQTHTRKWPLWRNCLPLAISTSSTWWAAFTTPLPLSWSMPLWAISMTTSTNTRMRSVYVYIVWDKAYVCMLYTGLHCISS